MREIKFRAKDYRGNWQYGTYAFGCFYPDSHKSHRIFPYGDYINENTLGQYTGLKDRKGEEIYEGDIVRISEWKMNGEVNFVSGMFKVRDPMRENFNPSLASFMVEVRCEIIGNIYEEVNTDESESSI